MWTGKWLWSDDEAIMVMFKVYQKQPLPIPSYVVLSDLGKDFKHRCFAMDLVERASYRTLATSILGASGGLGI